MAIFKEVLQP
ncbi:hypothetical protein D049_5166A, partial [Vibrio parahaemolyticus VPTS-2010]